MSRRRYISTDISLDKRINLLAKQGGDFAVMLYVMMIPHADDLGYITGEFEELTATVLPMRRDVDEEQVESAVRVMESLGLLSIDEEARRISFPSESFYKYQTYIPADKRRGATDAGNRRRTPRNAEERRESPENPAYPSPSPSPIPSPSPQCEETITATGGKVFSESDALPLHVQNFLEESCPDFWEAHLRLALAGRAFVNPAALSSYALEVLRSWKKGKNAPQAPLPETQKSLPPPEPLQFPRESLLQRRLREQAREEGGYAPQ